MFYDAPYSGIIIAKTTRMEVFVMKWEEARNLYPNQFIKLKVLKSHVENDAEYIDDIALIGPVSDQDATKELLGSKDNLLVFHTAKENIILKIRNRIALRRIN